MSKSGKIFLSLIAISAILSAGTVCLAEDDKSSNENTASGHFDQGQQGDALGGLERTTGKTVNDVNVPDVPAPEPVSTSSGNASCN
jgi:hypothetical protein